MIQVIIQTHNQEYKSVISTGHADYSEAGSDIVCAAVSVLAYTCVNALETVAGLKPQVRESSGRMVLALPDGGGHDAQVILKTLCQGLRDLKDAYPDYVLLNENQA